MSVAGALRDARVFTLAEETVLRCLDPQQRPIDGLFETAFRSGLAAVPPHRRTGALSGATGHVTESVVELLLVDAGYHPIWHFTGPGRHGVDLLMLGPEADHVLAVEVKGTLRSGRWPRLTAGELQQMTGAWLDKIDNPGMAEWDLHADDVYGAVVLVRLAERRYKVGITADHTRLHPLAEPLADLSTAVLRCPRDDCRVTPSSA